MPPQFSSMDRSQLIELYFHLGLKYTDILYILSARHGIVVSLKTLKRFLKKNGLFRRKHFHNLEEVILFIREELAGSGQLLGYRWMHNKCKENGLYVRKEDVRVNLSSLDPAGTDLRRKRRLNRRAYFARGPNFVWHVDSYDKLKPFGICINGAIDGFSRKILWLNAYNTNSDPKVIGGYFLETVRETGGCPRIVRADMGTENSCTRDIQRFLRRNDGDINSGEKSFIYGRRTSNQRIESWWGVLRKECVEFWLEHLHSLKDEGVFDGEFLDKNLIIFSFLRLIQDELDATKDSWNSHLIRPSGNHHVPHGRPDVMHLVPELYNTQDYLCQIPEEEVNYCENDCIHRHDIACDDDVFTLCTSVMAENGLDVPQDAYKAIDLYLYLREELSVLVNIER